MPRLVGLMGRAPVHFESARDEAVDPVDVAGEFPLARHRLGQHSDRLCSLLVDGSGGSPGALGAALRSPFGDVTVRVERGSWPDGAKVVPYESGRGGNPGSL